jgi:hypothetical protein
MCKSKPTLTAAFIAGKLTGHAAVADLYSIGRLSANLLLPHARVNVLFTRRSTERTWGEKFGKPLSC